MTTSAPAGRTVPRSDRTATADAVGALVAHWRASGTAFVVVDDRGRHADELAAGRLDLTRAATVDETWIDATLTRTGYVLLDARNVSRASRPLVIGHALAAVQRLRRRTGRPEWILIENAQDVLRQPGIPLQPLRIADGGYCLAARGGALPASVVTGAAFDVHVSQPGLELSLLPTTARRG